MAEDEIARLTADVNRFALSHGWLPSEDSETVWDTWRLLRSASSQRTANLSMTHSDEMLPVWEQCSTILNGLLQHRNAYLFSRPVDPLRDGVPNYFEVVKKPMDLGTVEQKLALNARRRREPVRGIMYRRPDEFKADLNLVWENCFLYNPPGYEVRNMGVALKTDFERRWKAMRIEEAVDRINRKLRSNDGHLTNSHETSRDTLSVAGKVLKKRKPGSHDSCKCPGAGKLKDAREVQEPTPERKQDATNGGLDKRKQPHVAKRQHEKQRGPGSNTRNKPKKEVIDSKCNKAKVDNAQTGTKSKCPNVNGNKKPNLQSKKSGRTMQGEKMMKLLKSCKRPTLDHTENGCNEPQREWKPPIERGGSIQETVVCNKQSEKPPEKKHEALVPCAKSKEQDVWEKCCTLNEELRQFLKRYEDKDEAQMTDYEVRRRLSDMLETMSQTLLNAFFERIISRDPCFKNGACSIDELEIGTVRKVVHMTLLNARKKKDKSQQATKESLNSSEKPISLPLSTSPAPSVAGNPPKRKRADDDCRLATKTPMVSPPSPPWHRRLTHKREVWDNAVGLCGVTPRQEGADLGLTPRQESNGSSWEEAVPDDVEDGEILD